MGDMAEAYARAEAAVARKPAGVQDAGSMLVVALFAEGRQQAIWQAMREKKEWPAQWLTDVNAAYSVLALHPEGTDLHVAGHVDFLSSLGATAQAGTVLEAGLARFPESWTLHDRLRARILAQKGAQGLEPAYAERLARPDASPNQEWFAGYAAIVAAEFHRRDRKPELALAAYDRAIQHYEQALAANPDSRETCDHYVALALAGRARIALESGDLEAALAGVLASFQRREQSAATLDGLNLSPVDTAKMLRGRLETEKRTDLAEKLKAAMDALDPQLLELPAYEREVPPASRPQRRGPRRGR
jgi:tetratricopeptide (TPR) repeat protein